MVTLNAFPGEDNNDDNGWDPYGFPDHDEYQPGEL